MERHGAAVSITTARASRSADISGRQTRYVLSMLVRTLCFVGAVFADGVLRWVLVAGAVFLPYMAVILANAGVQRDPLPPDAFTNPAGDDPVRGELDPGPPPAETDRSPG